MNYQKIIKVPTDRAAGNKWLGNMAAGEYRVSTFVFQFGFQSQLDGTQPSFCTIFELNNKAKLRVARGDEYIRRHIAKPQRCL